MGAREAAYTGSIPTAKLKVMGIDLVTAGAAEGARAVVAADEAAGTYRKVILDGEGRAAGAILLGDARGHELLTDVVKRGEPVEDPLALLAEASAATAADLPDGAQVCNCNGVCKGEILDAVRARRLRLDARGVARHARRHRLRLVQAARARAAGARDAAAPREEPAYLCPCRQQTREQLAALVRERELESASPS